MSGNLAIGAIGAAAIALPGLAATVTVASVCIAAVLDVCRLARARGSDLSVGEGTPSGFPGWRPFVSIHLPIHDEPPEVVIRTLGHLAALDYPGFEVLVLDNNTADPGRWGPVENEARALGPRFRFRHASGVRDAKAGALRITRAMTDPKAELIAVIDADYAVEPDFLLRAVEAFSPDLAFVQFPQAYLAEGAGAEGAALEATEYFALYPDQANETGAALLTGTLLVLRVDALDAVGGWSGRTVTEDAELGLRLCAGGFSGRFIKRPAGRGMLPVDLRGLAVQRRRWVSGNEQTLATLGVRRALTMRPERLMSILSQITTWFGWAVLPMAALLATALAGALLGPDPARSWLIDVSAVCLLAAVGFGMARLAVAARDTGATPAVLGFAAATRLALLWDSGFALIGAGTKASQMFRRTLKTPDLSTGGFDPLWLPGLVALPLMGVALGSGDYLAASGLALIVAVTPSRMLVDHGLRRSAGAASGAPVALAEGDARCV